MASDPLDAGLRTVLQGPIPNGQLARKALTASGIVTTRVVAVMRVPDGLSFARTVLATLPSSVAFDVAEAKAVVPALEAQSRRQTPRH